MTTQPQKTGQPPIAGLIGLFQLKTSQSTGNESKLAPAKALLQENTAESVFDPDYRVLVDRSCYQDGGIYRSIVKLQMRYEGQTGSEDGWYMGTAWLVTPDIMVTAGHNVYNWSGGDGENGLGKAVIIKCHIGYAGKDSIGTANVQSRLAHRIVTSAEWLASKDNRHRDFAFIQVDRPFTGNLRLFEYKPTPMSGEENIGVVGYPGDKSITSKSGSEERGALMYKQSAPTTYDRQTSKLGLLTYRISTFGGQSGAPVIREGRQVGIATHVYGFGDKNQASPITDYANFQAALNSDCKFPRVGSVDGIDLYKPIAPGLDGHESFAEPGTEESLLEALKSIGSVVSTIGQAVVPTLATTLLGPIGAPVSAVTGAALGVLGKVCAESARDGIESTAEGLLAQADALVNGGEAQHGVLAEATLQALERAHQVDPHHPVLKGIHNDMAKTYFAMEPCVKHLTPHFKHGMIRGAALIGCGTNFMAKSQTHMTTRDEANPIRKPSPGSESAHGESNAFTEALMAPTKPLQGEEAFFNTLGDFFSKALKFSKPILRETAAAGLNAISKRLASSGNGSESAAESGDSRDETTAATLVLKRAVMAECALQAVHKLSAQQLAELKVCHSSESEASQESFISILKTVAQGLGSVAKAAAPIIVKDVIPAVLKAATKGQESTRDFSGNGAHVIDPWGRIEVNGSNGSNGIGDSGPWDRNRREGLAPGPKRQPSQFFLDGIQASGIAPGSTGIAVRALLPEDRLLTANDVVATRSSPLKRIDSNEDLPVYQIYE